TTPEPMTFAFCPNTMHRSKLGSVWTAHWTVLLAAVATGPALTASAVISGTFFRSNCIAEGSVRPCVGMLRSRVQVLPVAMVQLPRVKVTVDLGRSVNVTVFSLVPTRARVVTVCAVARAERNKSRSVFIRPHSRSYLPQRSLQVVYNQYFE